MSLLPRSEALFDLENNPSEQNKLIKQYPELAQEFRNKIKEWKTNNKRK